MFHVKHRWNGGAGPGFPNPSEPDPAVSAGYGTGS